MKIRVQVSRQESKKIKEVLTSVERAIYTLDLDPDEVSFKKEAIEKRTNNLKQIRFFTIDGEEVVVVDISPQFVDIYCKAICGLMSTFLPLMGLFKSHIKMGKEKVNEFLCETHKLLKKEDK